MISSKDFDLWLTDPVTVAFMNVIKQRIIDSSNYLSYNAGTDTNMDNFLRGFIAGQREVLEVSFEESEND